MNFEKKSEELKFRKYRGQVEEESRIVEETTLFREVDFFSVQGLHEIWRKGG